MVKVGLIGLGFMGRMHFGCYGKNPDAQVVAISDTDPAKLAGAGGGGNIAGAGDALDLTGVAVYADYRELLANPEIDAVDICLPTRLHAALTIEALRAGKHVLCEKPMAFTVEECREMEAAAKESGKQLLIGHCLRYWPHYVEAQKMIASGEFGKPLYARFHRFSGVPHWSNWLVDGSQSGGAVLDMHIHDVDTALWWFGKPDAISAKGIVVKGMPAVVDAAWTYNDGPVVELHGSWDINGGGFKMEFHVILETGSIAWDSSVGNNIQIHQGHEIREIEVDTEMGYQYEIDDLVAAVKSGQPITRVTPESSRVSVEIVLEELRQLGF